MYISISHLFIVALAFSLIACKSSVYTTHEIGDKPSMDTVVGFDLSMFNSTRLDIGEISEGDYKSYEKRKKGHSFDPEIKILGQGISLNQECLEVCTVYIVDASLEKGIELPTSFDEGINGMILSPSRSQLIVYSSVGELYKPYKHRAEFFGFDLIKNGGLKGLKPSFKYVTKDFGITSLFWINEKTFF